MDVNTIIDEAEAVLLKVNMDQVEQIVQGNMMIVLIVLAVIGLFWNLLGLKTVRIWSAILGLAIGLGIGEVLIVGTDFRPIACMGISLVIGIVFACFAASFYKVGVFFIAWLLGASLSVAFIRPQDWIFVLICAGIGFCAALLILKFLEPVIIVLSAVSGAYIVASVAVEWIEITQNLEWGIMQMPIPIYRPVPHITEDLEWNIVFGVLSIIGIIVQFALESKTRKRQHLRKAEEIKEQNSTENEVEKARAMFDDFEDEHVEEPDLADDTKIDGTIELDEEIDEEIDKDIIEDIEDDDDFTFV